MTAAEKICELRDEASERQKLAFEQGNDAQGYRWAERHLAYASALALIEAEAAEREAAGMVLVPEKPTAAIVNAAARYWQNSYKDPVTIPEWPQLYRAMIEAAQEGKQL